MKALFRAHRTGAARSWLLSLVWVVAICTLPATLGAQEEGGFSKEKAKSSKEAVREPGEVSNIVEELSEEIYSPYCPGKTLAMCPSGGAAEVRRDIQEMAEHGVPKEEIKERVIEEHGEEYRLKEPPAEDNYPLAGMIAAALLVCIVAVVVFVRSGGGSSDDSDEPPEPEDLSEEDEIYLEELRSHYRD